MSLFSRLVKENRAVEETGAERNFMGGISYRINPLDTLKMVTASSIFGEPQYYRDGEFTPAKIMDGRWSVDEVFRIYSVLDDGPYAGKSTSRVMETVIDDALDYDYEQTLRWAVTLRTDYNMRLNPQVIMVRAAAHPGRAAFNEAHPGLFSQINARIMQRADEPASQLMYYLYTNKSKKKLPTILKRNWAAKLESLNAYQVHKYKNAGIGMIDVVRICHAHSGVLDELMKTGNVTVAQEDRTWETMRSAGSSWRHICEAGVLRHMALLRNLRGIFAEIEDREFCKEILEDLKAGVRGGKQFPFRYYSALKALRKVGAETVHHVPLLMEALEECMDLACENMPRLSGKTICLSDNSGSAWGTLTSEYGSVKVAEIDNLSSVITACNSDEGYVGKFGDRLLLFPVTQRRGILHQAEEITEGGDGDVGPGTENGIWIFFRDAIDQKQHWDNIFIYSDMQAGHGGLYGTDEGMEEYRSRDFVCRGRYVDVAKLIAEYRKRVNPRVNVYCVQTAGYHNVLVPEYGYRTCILYGWTGREAVFADAMNRFWDEKDADRLSENQPFNQ